MATAIPKEKYKKKKQRSKPVEKITPCELSQDEENIFSESNSSQVSTKDSENVENIKDTVGDKVFNIACAEETNDHKFDEESKGTIEDKSPVMDVGLQETRSDEPTGDEKQNIRIFETPTAPVMHSLALELAHEKVASSSQAVGVQKVEQMPNPESTYQTFLRKNKELLATLKKSQESMKSTTKSYIPQCHCPEINQARQLEDSFIACRNEENYESDPIYKMLCEFLNLRLAIRATKEEIDSLNEDFGDMENKAWIFEPKNVVNSGRCKDGKKVYATATFSVAKIDDSLVHNMEENRKKSRNLLYFSQHIGIVKSTKLKFLIEDAVRKSLIIPRDAEEQHLCFKDNIKNLISIMFIFLRKETGDKEFRDSILRWLKVLVSALLKDCSWEDNLFILFHLLRSPSNNSIWSSRFLQLNFPNPEQVNNFADEEINRFVSFMLIMLSPVRQRNEFLKGHAPVTKDLVKDDSWTLLDSDGEETSTLNEMCLKETDMITFLNQIPFENFFCYLLRTKKLDGSYIISEEILTTNQIVKIIGLSSVFISCLGEGLKTYNTERHKQFTKRLGRFIAHNVLYISDLYELICSTSAHNYVDIIHVTNTFEEFFINASKVLYNSRNVGTWQYLSSLPFRHLSVESLWKLFYLLNSGFQKTQLNEDYSSLCLSDQFEEEFKSNIVDVQGDDLHFMLQTFVNMIFERSDVEEWDFLEFVTSHIYTVGFVNPTTKDLCYKMCRDMLVVLTSEYPNLMNGLLMLTKTDEHGIENGTYIFKLLSLNNWKPSIDVFDIISFWLLHFRYECKEHIFARTILSRLNWDFDDNGQLFLPHPIHVRIAIAICQSLNKYKPESIGESDSADNIRITEIKNYSPKDQFSFWCWKMCFILKLHIMDQSNFNKSKILYNLGAFMQNIPEVESIDGMITSIAQSRPLSLYLSLMITSWGHSIPLICQKGFTQMLKLLDDHRYLAVTQSLFIITPLFLGCSESLSFCKSFQSVIIQFLKADCTYFNAVKKILTSDTIGPVLEMFGNMIQCQIRNYKDYGLQTPTRLILLWLECLTQPVVFENQRCFYLIDVILKMAFCNLECWSACKQQMKNFYRKERKMNKSSVWQIFSGESQSNTIIPSSSAYLVFFTLMNLEVTHELYEAENRFWSSLLIELHATGKKFNMENVVKNVAQMVGGNVSYSSDLAVYKYAEQIIAMSSDNPFLVIFCQKFFMLYLARILFDDDVKRFQTTYAVSEKFYASNINLMKKLKKKLSMVEEHYNSLINSEWTSNDQRLILARSYSRIFHTFGLWLEKEDLNRIATKEDIRLPPEYDLKYLLKIMFDNEAYWTEFVDFETIFSTQAKSVESWLKTCHRWKELTENCSNKLNIKEKDVDPITRIKRRLQSYDVPEKPLKINFDKCFLKDVTISDINAGLIQSLEEDLKVMLSAAKNFYSNTQQVNCLDLNYIDLLRGLYINEPEYQQYDVECNSDPCTGATRIIIETSTIKTRYDVKSKMQSIRSMYNEQMEIVNSESNIKLVQSIEKILKISRSLCRLNMKYVNQKSSTETIRINALKLFYNVIYSITDEVLFYPITNDFLSDAMSELGIFIKENQESEGINILKLALTRPALINSFSELVVPIQTSSHSFLTMYKVIVDAHMRNYTTEMILTLLLKFDVQKWLQLYQPKRTEVTKTVELLVSAIEKWNSSNTYTIQELFRKHLIDVFEYNFPEHYGEVLQMVLSSCDEGNLNPIVLTDLLNSLLLRTGCDRINLDCSPNRHEEEITKFAKNQKLFDFKCILDTLVLFTKHFQEKRLKFGLHGLYPKYKTYCLPLSILFSLFSQTSVLSAVFTYPGVLADKICDWVFYPITELYSPWIAVYDKQSMRQNTANWIKQLISNEKPLLPWSEQNISNAEIMLQSFIKSLKFILDALPVSTVTLNYVLSWYEYHYVKLGIPSYVLIPVHTNLLCLPWVKYQPSISNSESMCKILKEVIPECHSFLGSVFIQTDWNKYFQNAYPSLNSDTQTKIAGSLFEVFIKISFEPYVIGNPNVSVIYDRALEYPWHKISFQYLEHIFKSFAQIVEPLVILKLQSESSRLEVAVLELLKVASEILVPQKDVQYSPTALLEIEGKRILYIRCVIMLLKGCCIKNRKLLSTDTGLKAFNDALTDMIRIVRKSSLTLHCQMAELEAEIKTMLIEIMSITQKQDPYISNLFLNALMFYQGEYPSDPLIIFNTLNAISTCEKFTASHCLLLETTLVNYFNQNSNEFIELIPSWKDALRRLRNSLEKIDENELIKSQQFLSIHLAIIYKTLGTKDMGVKIIFLQIIYRGLQNAKISWNNSSEVKIAIVWSAIVSICFCLSIKSDNGKSLLLEVIQYIWALSERSESLSQTLLGALGFRNDTISQSFRVFSKSLCTLALRELQSYYSHSFSCDKIRKEYIRSMDELKQIGGSKQYGDLKIAVADTIRLLENDQKGTSNCFIEKLLGILMLYFKAPFIGSLSDVWNYVNTEVST